MADILVDTTVTAKGDGHTSLQEAFDRAVKQSIATGVEVTIHFAQAMSIDVTKTLVVPKGAAVALDGAIANDSTVEIGTNDVVLFGDNGAGYNPNSSDAYGHTLMKVVQGGSLRLVDVELADNLVAGADGKSGKSGSNGLNGHNGGSAGLPGSAGNGGLSVASNGHGGQDAVAGVLNQGNLVLDRVNMNGLKAYAGDGGAGGSGGDGGDGGNGDQAPGGAGGPGGSGTGHGGHGGDAASGVLNLGTLTMLDTSFQSDLVYAGQGGAGGSGGSGGKGGTGTVGGFGGNGGAGGTGGAGGDAAVTVLNRGAVDLVGGWVYDPGANLVFGGSGLGGQAGNGGAGGAGGKGTEMDGFNGVGGSGGAAGGNGTSGAGIGWNDTMVATAYYMEAASHQLAEFAGAYASSGTVLTVYRLGDAAAAGSVTLALTGVSAGADGANVQGGLFGGQIVSFAAGQTIAQVFVFAQSDGVAGMDETYRFSLTGSTGGALGGNVSADVTLTNSDIVGDDSANSLTGTKGAEVLLGGLGNDTLDGKAGDDKIDGQGGFDIVDYSAVQLGRNGIGLTADLSAFTASGKGAGHDAVFNVEGVIGSAFADHITGSFNSDRILAGAGDDRVLGGFNNDTLLGQAGNDRLNGGDLNDNLDGGFGRDTLTGGSGADAFVFSVALIAGNLDHINDFSHADDTIVLTRTGTGPFDALTLGALAKGGFHLGAVATAAGQHVLYDRTTGTLYYDPDGLGGVAAQAFAILDHAPKLFADDFLVI